MIKTQKNVNTKVLITSSIYAFSVTICFLIWWLYHYDFSIPKDSIPLIGQASKDNVLIAARIELFYKLIFVGTFLWIALTWLFQRFYNAFINTFKDYSKGLYFTIPIIVYAFLVITGVLVVPTLYVLLGVFGIFIVRSAFTHSKYFEVSDSETPVSFELTLGFSFIIHILLNFFIGHLEFVQRYNATLLLFTIVLMQLIFLFLRRLINHRTIEYFLLIISGIPFFVFISIELHILALEKHWFIFGYKNLFCCLELLWVFISWLIIKKNNLKSALISKRSFVLSLIFGFTLLLYYNPITSPSTEFFELANSANSVLRVFQFGEIPIIDFMSSHMMYEQWYGILYQAIFGASQQLDFTIYAFLNIYIYYVIIYWILIKVGLNDSAAVIFIFSFPILDNTFLLAVIYVFLVLFAIQKYSNKSTVNNAFLLFFLSFVLVLWRIDTGVAAILATLIFLPIYWWMYRKPFPTINFIKGFGLFILLIVALSLLTLTIYPWDYISVNFLSALHYVKASQAHGYSNLISGSPHQFFVIHALFVVVAVLLSATVVYIIRNNNLNIKDRNSAWLIFSIFSFVVFIVNAQRGLVRHGFIEQNEIYFFSTFYLGVAFFLVHIIRKKNVTLKFSLLFTVLFFSFIITKYNPFTLGKTNSAIVLKPDTFKQLNYDLKKENYQGRIKQKSEFINQVYGDLKEYMDTHLAPNESFIDFSNTPILYYYCKRKIPGYFNQNLQNTVDEFLQNKLIEAYDDNVVPLTVYSNYPPDWYDETDGILNTVRYYLVAEYIFEHYRPIGILNKRSIWGLKNRQWENISEKDTIVGQPIDLYLGYLAGWEGNKYVSNSENLKMYSILKENSIKVSDSLAVIKVEFNEKLLNHNHVSLLLKVDSNKKNQMIRKNGFIIFRDPDGKEVHRFSYVRDDSLFSYYAFRLSNHYFWHNNKTLTVELPDMEGIQKVLLIKE